MNEWKYFIAHLTYNLRITYINKIKPNAQWAVLSVKSYIFQATFKELFF